MVKSAEERRLHNAANGIRSAVTAHPCWPTHEALPAMMEPDNVKETPSHDFPFAAAGGDLCNGPRGLDLWDKRYWPSEVSQSTQITTVVSQRDLNSAFAYDWSAPRLQPATTRMRPDPHGGAIRVGPKSR